jgi:hypothetical protein
MKKILLLVLLIPFLNGCSVVGLMWAGATAPAHTSFDYETGGYMPDPGYHWEPDPKDPEHHQIVVKNTNP